MQSPIAFFLLAPTHGSDHTILAGVEYDIENQNHPGVNHPDNNEHRTEPHRRPPPTLEGMTALPIIFFVPLFLWRISFVVHSPQPGWSGSDSTFRRCWLVDTTSRRSGSSSKFTYYHHTHGTRVRITRSVAGKELSPGTWNVSST